MKTINRTSYNGTKDRDLTINHKVDTFIILIVHFLNLGIIEQAKGRTKKITLVCCQLPLNAKETTLVLNIIIFLFRPSGVVFTVILKYYTPSLSPPNTQCVYLRRSAWTDRRFPFIDTLALNFVSCRIRKILKMKILSISSYWYLIVCLLCVCVCIPWSCCWVGLEADLAAAHSPLQ